MRQFLSSGRTALSAFTRPSPNQQRALSAAAAMTKRSRVGGPSFSRSFSTTPDSPEPTKKPTIEDPHKSIPAPDTTTADQESLMARFITGIQNGELPEEVWEMTEDAFLKLVGATINSAAALPLMVPLLRLMIGARNDQRYSVSIEKLGQVRLWQLVTDGRLMLARRVIASIMPAIFTQMTGLTGFNAMFLNSAIETSISGFPKSQKSEPYQRFRAIHGSTFGFIGSENLVTLTNKQYTDALKSASENPLFHHKYEVIDESIFNFLDSIEPKLNLATITEQQYQDVIRKFEEESGEKVDEKASYAALRLSYKRLQVLQKNFTDNIPYQSVLLGLRNAAFSSGIFLAKSGATEFVESAGEFLQGIGLEDEKVTIEIASLIIRIGCAIATAPIDNALTKLSSGEMSIDEFKELKLSEQFSFRGALARTAFVLCAFFTIVYGSETGEFVKEKVLESPLFIATVELLTKGLDHHRQLKTGSNLNDAPESGNDKVDDETKSRDLLSTLMQFTNSEIKGDEIERKSIALLKFLLGDATPDSYVSELEDAKNFLDQVLDYISKNPGLFAGIGEKDSDIILGRPSANPSGTQTPEKVANNDLTK